MKNYKAYIFDLDGTLLNTFEDIHSSINQLMATQGWPQHSIETVKSNLGDGLKVLLERSIPIDVKGQHSIDTLYRHFQSIHGKRHYKKSRPFSQVSTVVATLKKSSKKLAVLSNKNHQDTINLTNRHFPNTFDFIIGERLNQHIPMKPHPQSLLDLIDKLEVSPSEVVLIGDTEVDFHTAKNAHIDFIAVTWGCRNEMVFKVLGAQKIITSPNGLLHNYI